MGGRETEKEMKREREKGRESAGAGAKPRETPSETQPSFSCSASYCPTQGFAVPPTKASTSITP
jgi:hypothetical protein